MDPIQVQALDPIQVQALGPTPIQVQALGPTPKVYGRIVWPCSTMCDPPSLTPHAAPTQELHARLEPYLLFFIDGASAVESDDPRWELLLVIMKQVCAQLRMRARNVCMHAGPCIDRARYGCVVCCICLHGFCMRTCRRCWLVCAGP